MDLNGAVDLFVELFPSLDIFGCKPAAHTFVLQVGVQTLGEFLIFSRVADETGVELDRGGDKRRNEGDEVVGNAGASQEDPGNPALGAIDSVNPDGRRSSVLYGFERLSHS